jgi:uncharacterized protein
MSEVAVVGTGVSGLVAAAELERAGHHVTVYEAGSYAGGHTNTVGVEDEQGRWQVDTGFIVMNDRNYPNFERLLAELGVETQPTQMSFGVADLDGGFEWAARGARGIFARPTHAVSPRFIRMLADLVRFNRDARSLLGAGASGPSLRRFLADGGYSEYFVERLLVPQVSAVWSADPSQLWEFPAAFLAEFFDNHGVLQVLNRPRWRTIAGGSQTYVKALSAPFAERIHLDTPVHSIARSPGGEEVVVRHRGGESRFDEVVLAVHSDQALAMLEQPTDREREVLGAIPYQENEAVLHTDTSLMPKRRAAWACWNFHLGGPDEGAAESEGRTTVTYDMNRLQSLAARRRYLVSLNCGERIDPERVIRRITYSHPVFSNEAMRAQNRWAEISGADRIHYCGAYWRWGFHEDGAWSGLRVSAALGGRGPGLEGAGAADAEPERGREGLPQAALEPA